MKITDLNGAEVEVDNLDLALMQADDYRYYRRTDPACAEADGRLAAYWEDIYQKLVKLKAAP